MTTDLTMILENRPSALADVAEAFGRAGVNIEGMCCFVSEAIGMLHVAVEHADEARREAERMGLKIYEERPVAVVQIEDRPGAAGEVLRRIGHAHINMDLVYFATQTRLVIGSHELDKLRAIV